MRNELLHAYFFFEVKRMKFNEIQSRNQLADFLGIQRKTLTYVLFEARVESFYSSFDIPKKDGTLRNIYAPSGALKIIQRKLTNALYEYQTLIRKENGIKANISHAFEKNKSIVSNARIHKNKRFIFCVDLNNFFNAFHFGRVFGYFLSNRYFNLPKEVAVTIAQLACYKGILPQGAPSSPIITNLICQTLDIHVLKIAKKYKLDYTRYADDLTFSTNNKDFLDKKDEFFEALKKEIEKSGFSINEEKTRLIYRDSRQMVTGLVVNHKINVPRDFYRATRAMLHALYTTGEFKVDGEKGTIAQLEGRLSFIDQIEFYCNKHDISGAKHNYRSLSGKETDYRNFLFYKYFVANKQMLLITEGKTDVLYIKAALKSLYKEYPKLITKDSNGKFRYNLSFFSRSRHWSYFFGMGLDGADAMKSLYNYFVGKNGLDNLCDYFLKYKTEFSPHPTIMLFDNEKNTKRPLNKFIGYAELCELKKEQLEKENYVLLEPNCKLNLVSVPLPLGKSECELEDLFSEETLNIEIGGRKFSRKDENPQKYYNKDIFSKYIFQNYEKIDFTGFKPLLNILNMLNESNG